ncbi:MAG TPA: TIGR03936 family radical SAM-associated protein [Armatimonadota bacterium]|nr:TIGR03936 family radical SAM-associated protein [Armatimonadota bacterium]
MSRVLLKLSKGDKVKYISHLDLIRAFELALRRARIPVAYSSGFNPRPRMSFGPAIGVGVTSDDERIVVELASPEDPSDILEKLNSQLPDGMELLSAEAVNGSPLAGPNASRFQIAAVCGGECSPAAVARAVEQLMESAEVRVARVREGKTKEVDIRPFLLQADVTECEGRSVVLNVSLRLGDSGGARPQDFVQALLRLVPNLTVGRIHRLSQFRVDGKADSAER